MASLQLHYERKKQGGILYETEYFVTDGPRALQNQARLERRLKSLHRRHVEASLLTDDRKAVGGVAPDDGINGWTWWYDSMAFETGQHVPLAN